MIAPTAIIKGVGITFGMDIVDVKGATGFYDSDLVAKADAAVSSLCSGAYDFCFLHIKGVDDAGHDKLPDMRAKMMEKSDIAIGVAL